MINDYYIKSETQTLLVFECLDKNLDPFQWVKESLSLIEEKLLKHGGILFRNFNIQSLSEFNKFVQILCPSLLDYIYRSTPRTKLGGKIYSATEYPRDRTIPLHNENSYTKSWPQKIIFYSAVVASQGGETPVADSRRIYQKINPCIRKKFEEKGIMYVRNYTKGIDLSWQEVFQTENKKEVEEFCQLNQISFKWNTVGSELTTSQICQASTEHPVTGDKVWFNQAHLFHISSIDQATQRMLLNELCEEYLPRNALLGDGTAIAIEDLEHIRSVYEEEKFNFKWQRKDIMMLDNLLMAHGREPYQGERKVAVAMS